MADDSRPLVLISNDDGIDAPGIHALADSLAREFDILVVAPDRERSATGHRITVMKQLRLVEYRREGDAGESHWGWSFGGTPADCVKVGVDVISRERKIDLVVSGINRGQNLGFNILYSGTVAAAREGAILGIPAIAFSQTFRDINRIDYGPAASRALDISRKVIRGGLPPGVILNVNFPACTDAEMKGVHVTRQGDSGFRDRFHHVGEHEQSGRLFANVGQRFAPSSIQSMEMDDHAIAENHISVTPLLVDATASDHINRVRDLMSG